eukprot:300933-Amphidinium_carterae.1
MASTSLPPTAGLAVFDFLNSARTRHRVHHCYDTSLAFAQDLKCSLVTWVRACSGSVHGKAESESSTDAYAHDSTIASSFQGVLGHCCLRTAMDIRTYCVTSASYSELRNAQTTSSNAAGMAKKASRLEAYMTS